MPEDVQKALDRAESLVYEVNERRVTDSMKLAVEPAVGEPRPASRRSTRRATPITGTPTGYLDLDLLLSGLQPSSLVVVGARPAMGKTSFALGMLAHAALEAPEPEAVPLLLARDEPPRAHAAPALLGGQGRLAPPPQRAAQGRRLVEHLRARWVASGQAPIYIDDNPNLTIMEIRAKARRLKSQVGKLGMIVIDYLQLMTGRSSAENRQVEVSELSRGLKILARELETPVVALSQLSRNLEMRADKRPMLADLRESGSHRAGLRTS